jgi:hypothetical protein
VTATATLVVLAGARFDLGIAAERVRRVVTASEAGGAEALDLFALLGAPADGPASRLIAVALSDGSELLITAHATIEVVTPLEVLSLPRIVTRGAPWLDALVLDGARPLLVIAPDRLRGHDPRNKPLPETAPLW